MKMLLLAFAVICFSITDSTHADDTVMTYRYWDWGLTPQRDSYQLALLDLALSKTSATHGEYNIIHVQERLSRARAQREIAEGTALNIHASPLRPILTEQDRREQTLESIPISVPLLQSLLGYRSLIIRSSDYEKFSEIKQASQLKALTAGQGRGWTDAMIYRHNGYGVQDNAEYFTLFSMLLAGRFDYVPLSVIEAKSALTQFKQLSNQLMILPDLLLYYPLPTLFHISAKHPALAERLEKGLALAKHDGSLEKLFEQHFGENIRQMRTANLRVFVLKNPNVPSEMGLDEPLLLNTEKSKIPPVSRSKTAIMN